MKPKIIIIFGNDKLTSSIINSLTKSKKLVKFVLYRVGLLEETKLEVLKLNLENIYYKYYDIFWNIIQQQLL